MKNILMIALFAMLAPFALKAQNNNNMKEDKRYVEVTGVAEMEVVPNEIYLSITLQEEKDGQKRSVEDQEKVMMKKLKNLDVDADNLKLANVGAYTRWDKKTKQSYKQKTFELKLTNAGKASQVLYELNALEIYRIYVSRTDHSDIEEFRKQVKIDAVKAAKEKATYLLEAVDEKVGEIIYVIEQDLGNYGYRSMAMGVSNVRSDGGGYEPNPDVEFQPIKLQYKIIARFEIAE